jgi:hypothetical protein
MDDDEIVEYSTYFYDLGYRTMDLIFTAISQNKKDLNLDQIKQPILKAIVEAMVRNEVIPANCAVVKTYCDTVS